MLLGMSTLTFAQQAPKPSPAQKGASLEKRVDSQVAKMKTELKLTDEQASNVKQVMLEQAQKQQELMKQMRANREESKSKLKETLTQEQYIQLLEKQAQHHPRPRRMHRGSRG